MSWILVISGLLIQTETNLGQCQEHFARAIITAGVKDAYCQSTRGDKVWLMRDGKFFAIPRDE